MQERQRTSGVATALLGLMLAAAGTLRAQGVTAVPQFDATRYTGTWYEIAHYPNRREKNCTRNIVHVVATGDKPHSVQFVNACMTKRGYADASNVSARPQDKKTIDGRLKIPTLWPFSRKYWILAIGPEYEWALTGNPNHKELWIFSRTTDLAPETLTAIKAKADAMGFSSAKLVTIQQTAR